MILKYGGVLTHAGRKHAEELGRFFRYNMYLGERTGLLRLHSTYHHDLKIYSSDEGRVQMSAAAFAKGMLDLEGQLRQSWFSFLYIILLVLNLQCHNVFTNNVFLSFLLLKVFLVSKDSSMLDDLDTASIEMEAAKSINKINFIIIVLYMHTRLNEIVTKVALSRVKSRSRLKILITGKEGKPQTKTLNVVYKQMGYDELGDR
ncbi:hypothetical protein IGI04_035685 [Brassica rapa subsp. trilocularis]|uniref:diphosphoinositol-pentakisphosphate 1-kinase n=1 Tax=Brassica rapa subsp. trilocularis TaxID=1813537 RepID=A0ABQ7LE62_BRACM|nr:hypothetical protein IGI04_035685 [Brassica rapa subsp. trilocularis]